MYTIQVDLRHGLRTRFPHLVFSHFFSLQGTTRRLEDRGKEVPIEAPVHQTFRGISTGFHKLGVPQNGWFTLVHIFYDGTSC